MIEYIHVTVHVVVKIMFRFEFLAANITSELWLLVNFKVVAFITSPYNFAANGARPVRSVINLFSRNSIFVIVSNVVFQLERIVKYFATNFTG